MKIIISLTICILFTFNTVSSVQNKPLKCKVRLIKNSCWKNYELKTSIVRLSNNVELKKFTIKKDESQKDNKSESSGVKVVEFPCELGDQIYLLSSFSPIIWESLKDKRYKSKLSWNTPLNVKEGTAFWEFTACFPNDFKDVPQPLGKIINCSCKNSVVSN